MMELAVVNFDTAQQLKDLGFNEPSRYRYHDGDEGTIHECNSIDEVYSFQIPIEQYKWCLAPTQALVQQWLRNSCDIVVSVDYDDDDTYFMSLSKIPFNDISIGGSYPTYEQALEAGILEGMELVKIEQEKAKLPPQVSMSFVEWLGFNYPMMKNHGGTMGIHEIDGALTAYKKAMTWEK